MNNGLLCTVENVTVDSFHIGNLFVLAGECPDMKGTIKLFEYLDRDILAINVWSGQMALGTYFRDGKRGDLASWKYVETPEEYPLSWAQFRGLFSGQRH